MKNLINKISDKINSKFLFDYDTSKSVWFRAGGKAGVFCILHDENEFAIILDQVGSVPYEFIGAGSNLLVRDNGYEGILFKLGKKFNNTVLHQNHIEVGASILDINLAKFAEKNSIEGFEFLSGIPGSIGGAVKMNAGCYGSETKDILKDIKILNPSGDLVTLGAEELNLKYRDSKIPRKSLIVSANFNFKYGDNEVIKQKMQNIKNMRLNSQPIKSKTSGSSFKNPSNNFAAKLIEKAGCKGLNIGDAFVSTKHANFLINTNNASASELEELGKKIIERVYNKFNILLEWEIKIIGK